MQGLAKYRYQRINYDVLRLLGERLLWDEQTKLIDQGCRGVKEPTEVVKKRHKEP